MLDLYLTRAAILAEVDRIDDANVAVESLIVKFPTVSLTTIRRPPFKDESRIGAYLGALRRAGLPE